MRSLVFTAALLAISVDASAAGKARLELVGGGAGSAMVFQEWMQALAKAGIQDVRIRSDEGGKPGVETQGTKENPTYIVTGVIVSRDELLLPGGKFRRSDAGRLAEWLNNLAARGPEGGGRRGAFGLSSQQLVEVNDDLAQLVTFATKDIERAKVVERIGQKLRLPLRTPTDLNQKLSDKVAEELLGISSGTALAYLLRSAGYCLVPRAAGGKVEHQVVKSQPGMEIWPVGWPPKKDVKDVLPALHEFLNINIQQAEATTALEAIAGRLKTPVLLDYNAMARHGIDPAKAMVSLPQGRTTYSLALRKLLFQAGLKFEIRVDEADKSLLWVTTVKPM